VQQSREEVEHCRHEYAALMSMCDAYLGDLLDVFDELDLWKDTMLVVCTDHGFLLAEHDCWAKCWMPFYQEIAHTPLFVWDPRSGQHGQRRQALVQPALDIGPTLLRFFGLEPTTAMLGHDLAATVASDAPVREAAIFGQHGVHVNVTDGRYVYMRAPIGGNRPLYDYTLMPTHMRDMFSVREMQQVQLADPFSFTKGCRTMRIPAEGWFGDGPMQTRLYDIQMDPKQASPIQDPAIERMMTEHLVRLMRQCDAPAEQYERLGLDR
jgi:membrane-anchored protein YejM (alkaline phosphatase superfamily)